MTTSPTPAPPIAEPDQVATEPPASEPPATDHSLRQRLFALPGQAFDVLGRESLLIAILLGSFLARWLLADRNSYWLDEHYSVAIYGIWNNSALDAVRHLAETSVHPPLYQFILYNWMELFGDDERATRSLSNLYVVLATLFLYLLVRDAFSRRIAIASAATFALMYTPMYFGLETRSYAQTIFLVTVSSYALLWLMRTGAANGWLRAFRSPALLLLIGANVGLLLTHYYNAFFWVAQGVIAGFFVLRERPWRGWLTAIGVVAVIYGIQGGIFALVWGRILINDYRRRGGAFPAEGGVRSPLELLQSVVTPNVAAPSWLWWLGLAVAAIVVGRAVLVLARRGDQLTDRQEAWSTVYLLAWLLVPLLVVYAAFVATGVARYSPRYWLFILPPLAPLIVLTIREAVQLAGLGWRRLGGRETGDRWLSVGTTVGVAVMILTLIIPGTLDAASRVKTDWRGSAQNIVSIIEANPDSRYRIYETSFRRTPVLDYYFSRFSDDIRVHNTIRRSQERADDAVYAFEREAEELSEYDYIIVPFIHQRTTDFPIAMARLSETYRIHHWQINHNGRGFVIFAVHDESAESTSESS